MFLHAMEIFRLRFKKYLILTEDTDYIVCFLRSIDVEKSSGFNLDLVKNKNVFPLYIYIYIYIIYIIYIYICIYIYYVYAQLLGEVLYKALFYLICVISDRNFKFTAKK